jgi:type IV pilus assembly protein PilC
VSLRLREKESLYHSLAQLLRSGVPLPGALQSLAQTSSGAQRRLIQHVNQSINAGKSVGDSLAAQRPEVSDLEVGVVAGCEKSGRLEYGMNMLAGYYRSLASARERIFAKCAYPIFMLHFAILLFTAVDTFLASRGLAFYLMRSGSLIGLFWGVVGIGFLLFPLLRDAGSFCATYEMQLEAGINVIDALQAAQRASLSGLIKRAVQRAIPEIRNGAQVGPLLAASGAFPEPVTRAILVGEQVGQLDQELARLSQDYQEKGVARLETLTEWIPRILFVCILLYIGYRIITFMLGYFQTLNKIMEGM